MEKVNGNAAYINAVRAIDAVIMFKKEYVKMLNQEIILHENEKEHFMNKHQEVLEEIDVSERSETLSELAGIGTKH